MIFNSTPFFLFFSLFFLLSICINRFLKKQEVQLRNVVLLLASYYFYAFLKWEFVFLLFATTLVNYICALKIAEEKKKQRLKYAKYWLWFAVVFSIGLLGYFKYVNFFIDSVNEAFVLLGIGVKTSLMQIALPVGISFFTFQALTYSIDVYREKITARKDFIRVALFVSFFPTILSGPIERARNLIPQFEQKTNISWENIVGGGKLFLWGLFQKVVIADRLADYINIVYSGSIVEHSSLTLIVTAVFYSFQIYADFSGYSDMAIGIAKILGFNLMRNFNYPYFSTSIKEFWKRWHISLTSWFTEYVYLPLGGNRVTQGRWIFNISAVFLLSGLWHGANWSFIFWGALHAAYYLAEFYLKKLRLPSLEILNTIVVFALVTIAWIYFRVENFQLTNTIIVRFFDGTTDFFYGVSSFTMALTVALLILFIGLDWIRYKEIKFNPTVQALGYAFILSLVLLFGVSNSSFVYFQF
jgi:D-alanyl-lipoteichoic acid acyltransferase DltB (MBOAT superfamily)